VNWGGGGGGGELDENRQKFQLEFMPPLFEIEYCSTAGQASFVGLFIGHFFGIGWLNIANTNNHRCRLCKDDRHKKYRFLVSATLGCPTQKMVSLYRA
jgi:hypothetical protein